MRVPRSEHAEHGAAMIAEGVEHESGILRSLQPVSYPPPPHPSHAGGPSLEALSCPRCSARATPGLGSQRCPACGKSFTLSAGPALDPSVVAPPYDPRSFPINLKWSIVVTYQYSSLQAQGVTYGTLDPVVGMAPMDQSGIGYGDVISIALWRTLALPELISGALVPLPIALLCAWGAIAVLAHSGTKEAGLAGFFGVLALLFGLLTWYVLVHRGIVRGRRRARIVGRWRSFTVPFESSPAFHAELFRRCGLVAPPVP